MEKFMYCISPEYSGPLAYHAKDFSFGAKIYTDCKTAYNHLLNTNLASILGFIFLLEDIPEDPKDLITFIDKVNTIGDKNTLVLLAVKNAKGLEYLSSFLTYDNIQVFYITDFEIVTDTFIKRNLFGSILIQKENPYLTRMREINMITSYNSNKNLTPVLPLDILDILSPIEKMLDIKHTIENDKVLKENKDNALVCYLRMNRIKKMFGEEVDYDGMIKRIDASGVNAILYRIVCVMIEEGVM